MASFTYSRSPEEMAQIRRTLASQARKEAHMDMSMSPEDILMFMNDHPHGGHADVGAGWNEFADAFKHGPQHFFNRAANEITNKQSDLRAKIIPKAVEVAEKIAPYANAVIPGSSAAITAAAKAARAANAVDLPQVGSGRRPRRNVKKKKHHKRRGAGAPKRKHVKKHVTKRIKHKNAKKTRKGRGFMDALLKPPSLTETVKGLTGMW